MSTQDPKMYPTELKTPRLNLYMSDLQNDEDNFKLIGLYNDPFVGAYGLGRLGINHPDHIREKYRKHGPIRALCTKLPDSTPLPRSVYFLVYLKSTQEFIGMVGISFRAEMPHPDLGYAFYEAFNGQGLASEASREVLRFWREEIGVKDIFVGTFGTNVKSQALARRIGFRDGGDLILVWGDGSTTQGTALILPHMTWPKDGLEIRPTHE